MLLSRGKGLAGCWQKDTTATLALGCGARYQREGDAAAVAAVQWDYSLTLVDSLSLRM